MKSLFCVEVIFFNALWSVGLIFFKALKVRGGNDSAQEGRALLIILKCTGLCAGMAAS